MSNTKRKTKERVIILDLDDTTVGFVDKLCRLHNRLHHTEISPSDIKEYNIKKLQFTDCSGNVVTGEELWQTFQEYESYIYPSLKPLPEAREALQRIKRKGYLIFFLTARKPSYEKPTLFCLLDQDLPHDRVIFADSHDKAKVVRKLAKEYNVVAFADDKHSTVKDVKENTKTKNVYIVNQEHNRNMDDIVGVKRINGIFEIVRDLPEL